MPRNRPLIRTAFNGGAAFVLGLVTAQKGTSFNDLILITNTDVEGGSFYITASNSGFMLGCLLAGVLYGRIKTKAMTIATGLTISGLLTTLVPQCTIYVGMIFMQALASLSTGTYEMTVNAEEIQAWGGSSESAFQFLGFCASIGAVLSPLITRPFLAPKVTHVNGGDESPLPAPTNIPKQIVALSYPDSVNINQSTVTLCPGTPSNCTSFLRNELTYDWSTNENSTNQIFEFHNVTSNLQYAYLITGVSSMFMSIPFYVLCAQSITKQLTETRNVKRPHPAARKVPRATAVRLVALVSTFVFFNGMGTDSFSQYLFYFLVTHLDWSKEKGAYLMSLFWALGIPMKLLLVVIYKRIKVDTVILLSLSGQVVFIILFVLAGHFQIHALVWVACTGVSISQASIPVGVFAWTDGNLIPVDGRVTSVLMVFGCLGALSAPLLLGVLMKNWSLMSFPFCVLVQFSISSTLFLVMVYVVKPAVCRKYGPVRPQVEHIINSEGDAIETMAPNDENSRTENKRLESTEFI